MDISEVTKESIRKGIAETRKALLVQEQDHYKSDFPRQVSGYICSNGSFHEWGKNDGYESARKLAVLEESQIALAEIAVEICVDGEYELLEALTIFSDLDGVKKFALVLEKMIIAKEKLL